MLAVYSLFLATFCIGTTELVIAGLLPAVAGDLAVSIPTAGVLVTGYALAVAIGGPILTLVTARFPRRAMILTLMALFIAGHVLAALAPNYLTLLVARIVTATAHGCFFGLAMVVAIGLVPDEKRGRAMSLVFLGVTIANLLGVPAGTFIGGALGWRATFWILAALATAATVAMAVLIPSSQGGARGGVSVRAQFAAMGNAAVLSSFAIIILAWTALWSTLTYIAPLLVEVGGFPRDAVGTTMLAFGAGATVGIFIGGRLADLAPVRTLVIALPVCAGLFAIALAVVQSGVALSAMVFLLGVALCVLVTPLQNRVLRGAASAPDFASTLASSAYNFGIALGALSGGAILNAGFGYEVIPVIGIASMIAATLVGWLALAAGRKRSPAAS